MIKNSGVIQILMILLTSDLFDPGNLNNVSASVRVSLGTQIVKSLPIVQETRVQSLGQEAPPEKEMATHSSILAWKIPRTEEPGGLQSMGSQRVRHN